MRFIERMLLSVSGSVSVLTTIVKTMIATPQLATPTAASWS